MLLKYRPRLYSNGIGVATLLVVLLVFGFSSVANASSLYWYGENNSTCWQSGQPGGSSFACDGVGAGFLPGHMVEGGVSADVFNVSSSGDYCNYYRLGDQLTLQDSTNEGPTTGYTPPTPYGSYQETDGYRNVCQASGANWGQEVRSAAPGNGCWTTCGMHHYLSFYNQGLNNRPWNSAFGGPTLVVSAEADPQTLSYSAEDAGAWGYVCPVLQDVTTGGILEYCLQEWRARTNSSEWSQERVGSCAGAGGDSLDTIQTFFYPGTIYATQREGSANTFVLGSSGWRHYVAGISTGNLQNAISADNSHCGRSLSSSPQNYALLGVEQGLEGWRYTNEIGGSSRNLQLSTEYTLQAPSTTTQGATELTGPTAQLHGQVNPNSSDTHYYFEYGPTTSYGTDNPAFPGTDIGSGTGSVSTSNSISGLQSGATYHYRVVATNSAGTSWGGDQVFTEPPPPTVTTSAASEVSQTSAKMNGSVNPNGLDTHYYFEYGLTTSYGTDNPAFPGADIGGGTSSIPTSTTISELEPGTTYHYRVVATSTAGTSYGADHKVTTLAEPNVFFADANKANTITDRWYTPATGWLQTNLGGDEIAKTTSPTAVMDGNEANAFFVDASKGDTLTDRWYQTGVGWQQTIFLGDEVAKGTSPTVVMVGNEPNVFFVDASKGNTLTDRWLRSGVGWEQINLGGDEVAKGTSPTALMDGNEANVFFVDASKGDTLTDRWYQTGVGWQQTIFLGDEVASGTSPTAVMDGNEPNVFFVDATESKTLTDRWLQEGVGWQQTIFLGDEVASGTSPTAVMDINEPNVFFVDATKSNTLTDRWLHEGGGWYQTNFAGDPAATGTSPTAVSVGDEPNVFFVDATKSNTLTDRWLQYSVGWQQTNFGGDAVTSTDSPSVLGL
jgi:hypothetical protein